MSSLFLLCIIYEYRFFFLVDNFSKLFWSLLLLFSECLLSTHDADHNIKAKCFLQHFAFNKCTKSWLLGRILNALTQSGDLVFQCFSSKLREDKTKSFSLWNNILHYVHTKSTVLVFKFSWNDSISLHRLIKRQNVLFLLWGFKHFLNCSRWWHFELLPCICETAVISTVPKIKILLDVLYETMHVWIFFVCSAIWQITTTRYYICQLTFFCCMSKSSWKHVSLLFFTIWRFSTAAYW